MQQRLHRNRLWPVPRTRGLDFPDAPAIRVRGARGGRDQIKGDEVTRKGWIARLGRALRGFTFGGAWPIALAGLLGAAIFVLAPSTGLGQSEGPGCAGGPQVSGRQILGTPCADAIVAAGGIQEIHGAGGDDVIYATDDVVLIDGGGGDDVMHGEPPASLPAGAFQPSPPAESVPSEATVLQADCLPLPYCGDGNQTFTGGDGDDLAFGQRGNDNLSGGAGNDSLYGGTGDDEVHGGSGDDLLSGGFGADKAFGDNDNDLIRGDAGPDGGPQSAPEGLSGGPGDDTVSFATAVTPGFAIDRSGYFSALPPNIGERGVDVSLGGQALNRDARWGGGQDFLVVAENVIGSPFSDYIVGSDEANRIDGGGGADVILAGAGNDQIYGGADGDHLNGGGDGAAIFPGGGNDNCLNSTNSATNQCERSDPNGGVRFRSFSRISVGLMAIDISPKPRVGDLYLTGSSAGDNLSVAYSGSRVTFTEVGSTIFDASDDARTPRCTYPRRADPQETTKVTCKVPSPLDAIVLAGMAGNDNISASGFPETTSLVLLGGEGADALCSASTSCSSTDPPGSGTGEGTGEDMLVDGPDFAEGAPWADALWGFGGVDALLNNEGADKLFGGDLSDLLVSASVCDGDLLDGGPETIAGKNNASWAQFDGPGGVSAQIAEGIAGPTGGAACSAFDRLQTIDDLEGSNQDDELFGDGASNYLLGNRGQDLLIGREGNDILQTNDGEADFAADCGPDTLGALNDRAWIDDDFVDPEPLNCDSVQRLDPGQFPSSP
jgi:Ca2+-binding RTX toxin-like protein